MLATVEETNSMTDGIMNLGDIPDLSTMVGLEREPIVWTDGWYKAQIVEKREFTDKNGNDRTFASADLPSAKGDSRNITLQTIIARKDGQTLNSKIGVNYRGDDLTQDTIHAIAAQAEANKKAGGKPTWGTLFRSYMALNQLGTLQKVAGVRQFQRGGDGGLDITPLFGKTVYVRVGPDDRNPQYKAIVRFQQAEPKKVPVL